MFPLLVGIETKGGFHLGATGLLITGVFVPFLGLIGMLYSAGNRRLFFENLGKPIGLLLTFIMLSLLGPFAVIPRCTIVAHGGFSLIAPEITPPLFNAVFLGATMLVAWKKTKIIDIIGTYMTPFLLGGIVLIIVVSLFSAPEAPERLLSFRSSFMFGLNQGYQTMDLLAAFFFSATTVTFIAKHLKTHEQKQNLHRYGVTACLMGAFLLALIYVGFVALGAKYAPVLTGVDPETLLVTIAVQSLGAIALPISAMVIGLACLTTAAILTSLFVDFIYEDILKHKVPRLMILGVTIALAYLLSLMGFGPLAKWIHFALTYVYPSLIVYTGLEILYHMRKAKGFPRRVSTYGFYFTTLGLIVHSIFF